jgi:NAD(P)-dependent dehydrogenase (short-subunit alcohol dehydrogenase family)
MNFNDKVVLITGGGSGIGLETVRQYAKAGAKLVVNSIIQEHENAVKQVAGDNCVFVQGDITKPSDCKRIVNVAIEKFGRIDILANLVGMVHSGYLLDATEDEFMQAMDVNVKGSFSMMKYSVEQMIKTQGGVIVNVASVAALKGHVNRCVYSASKGALVSLSRAVATEYVSNGIRVNVICPGTTLTKALNQRIEESPDPDATRKEFMARQPIGRLGTESEIAHAILFASCDESAYMTGSVLIIDGGMTC